MPTSVAMSSSRVGFEAALGEVALGRSHDLGAGLEAVAPAANGFGGGGPGEHRDCYYTGAQVKEATEVLNNVRRRDVSLRPSHPANRSTLHI